MNKRKQIILSTTALLVIVAGLSFIARANYLLFHGAVEVFSIIIAFGIFFVAWNSREFVTNNYLLFLGVAYPFVAVLDFLHYLSYDGMQVFTGYGTNLPTQLWIQARYMEAITLLLAPFFFRRQIREYLVLTVYTVLTVLFVWSVFIARIFPDCFVQPMGLTPFKKTSEYIISLIFAAALILVVKRRNFINQTTLRYLSASIAVTIASELAFTFYISVYGFSNMVGHLLKILSYYFIYKGIIEACLRDPYNSLFLDMKLNEAELKKAEKRLLSKNKDLEAFLHTAGHDLRTPLVSIAGYAELLEKTWEKSDAERRNELIQQIKNGVGRMNALIKDLLKFAFVGRKEAASVEVDMEEVIDRIAEEKREEIAATGAQILKARQLPVLYMPETEAYQLFSNLISNSLKYNQPGVRPVIEVGVKEVRPGNLGTITVADNGSGIAEEDQDRIFELFVRLQNDGDLTESTGAGLAIVKRIVDHNGGKIRVDSTVGKGTTFTITLPVA